MEVQWFSEDEVLHYVITLFFNMKEMRMNNLSFIEAYYNTLSLQMFSDLYIQYVFERYKLIHLTYEDIYRNMSNLLQIDVNDVKQRLLVMGYDLETGMKK